MKDLFETFSIRLNNRDQFNRVRDVIVNSCGDLDVGYADMIFSFSDKLHFNQTIEMLNQLKIEFSTE